MYNFTNIRKRYIRVKVLIGPYFFVALVLFTFTKKIKNLEPHHTRVTQVEYCV